MQASLRLFTVVHTNGIHRVRLRYCSCVGAASKPHQLFSASLFPASTTRPGSAFTFEVLRRFQVASMESNSAANTFYAELRAMTDAASTYDTKVRKYISCSCMIH
jgi:hypothetical protein